MELATAIAERPLMSNLSRGLWGYHGQTAAGDALTVQSTGIGGPSAAIVVAELASLGVRSVVRVGTCRALGAELAAGDLLVADAALAADGVGSALGDGGPELADPALTALLAQTSAARRGTVVSLDLPYDPRDGGGEEWCERGALATDLSTAAVLTVARRHKISAASVLVVAEPATGDALADEALDSAALAAGEAAAQALARQASAWPLG